MSKLIPLTRGQFAIVDDDMYDFLMQWKWHLQPSGRYKNKLYASRREGNQTVFMHRVVNNTPSDTYTDHIDGNGLNCQRHNLRTASGEQNRQNRSKHRNGTTSQYKGVRRVRNKWRVEVGKTYIGYFLTELDAAKAYDAAAREHFGEFARLNFPEE